MIHFCKFIAGLLFLACLISFLWRKFDDRFFLLGLWLKLNLQKPAQVLFFYFLNFSLFASFYSGIFGTCMLSLATKKCHLKRMKDEFLQ